MDENVSNVALGVLGLLFMSLLLVAFPGITFEVWLDAAGVYVLAATFVAIVHYTQTTSALLKIELERKRWEEEAILAQLDLDLSLHTSPKLRHTDGRGDHFAMRVINVGGTIEGAGISSGQGEFWLDQSDKWLYSGHRYIYFRLKNHHDAPPPTRFTFTIQYRTATQVHRSRLFHYDIEKEIVLRAGYAETVYPS